MNEPVDEFEHSLLSPRLAAIHTMLMAVYDGGSEMSSHSKGYERELFVNAFLGQVFPPLVRFSSGDITDIDEAKSGQVDIVVESPYLFSFPLIAGGPRLHLAEGVAAAIEVKSDLTKQWGEVEAKAKMVQSIRRRFLHDALIERAEHLENLLDLDRPENAQFREKAIHLRKQADAARAASASTPTIPLYVVGYHGWKTDESIKKHLDDTPGVSGVLVLSGPNYRDARRMGSGPTALMMFLDVISSHIHEAAQRESPSSAYSFGTPSRKMRRKNERILKEFSEAIDKSNPGGG